MSNPRISVSQLKQLIQLRSNDLSTRDIARALSLSQGAVSKYCRAVLAGCGTWEEALALQETELEGRVYAARRLSPVSSVVAPDCAWIHTELKRHKHVKCARRSSQAEVGYSHANVRPQCGGCSRRPPETPKPDSAYRRARASRPAQGRSNMVHVLAGRNRGQGPTTSNLARRPHGLQGRARMNAKRDHGARARSPPNGDLFAKQKPSH
jgi:hypothetical protein